MPVKYLQAICRQRKVWRMNWRFLDTTAITAIMGTTAITVTMAIMAIMGTTVIMLVAQRRPCSVRPLD